MKFTYQARTKEGEMRSGQIEASSREAAIEVLQKYNIFITSLKEVKQKPLLAKEIKIPRGISQKEIMLFSRQIATMLDSKIQPAEAFSALAQKTRNPAFQEIIYKISDSIRGGLSLSKAFSRYPKIFSTFYIGMIKAGEVSGNLSQVLRKLSKHLQQEYHFRSQIIGAMIYPAIVFLVFILIFLFLLVYVIPKLTEVLIETGKELPLVTKIVIAISNFFVSYWWIILLILVAIFAFFYFYLKTREAKETLARVSLNLPILGNFLKNLYLARFAENLSTLIVAGIPIAQALEVTSDLIGNYTYQRIILQVRDRVIKGESISSVLERFPEEIPPLFVQMAAVGERTGRLSTTLMNIVRFYQREIDTFIDSLSSIIEPILIIGLALMVGFLAASVFLPLYQIGGAL